MRSVGDEDVLISGLGITAEAYGIANEVVGTPQYLAPEVIKGDGYGRAIDYWAVGIMMYDYFVARHHLVVKLQMSFLTR